MKFLQKNVIGNKSGIGGLRWKVAWRVILDNARKKIRKI